MGFNADTSDDEKAPSNSLETSHALISGVAFGGYARKVSLCTIAHLYC